MKNILLNLILSLYLFSANLFAQETLLINPQEECATDFLHNSLLQTDSLYKAKFNAIQNSIAFEIENSNENISNRRAPLLTVPIVFHVLHLGEPVGTGTNISQQQIHNALKSLNDAYRGIAPYNTSGIDMEIEFCLASQDPSGNPTDGINRVNASGVSDYATNGITTSGSNNQIAIKALSKWSNTNYYNIWIDS